LKGSDKMKKLTNFKFENIVFSILVIAYIYNATTNGNSIFNIFGILGNFIGLLIQITLCYGFKLLLEYIRKNPQIIADEIKALFKD
jgi:hypothetical protein